MADTTLTRASSRRAKREEKEQAKAIHRTKIEQQGVQDALRKPRAPTPEEQAAKAAKPRLTRKEQRVKAEAHAREQAARDALLKPETFVDTDATPLGEVPPLHVLNKRAQQATQEIRDEATEMGKKVGGLVRDLAMGSRMTRIGNRGNRFERMAVANERLAAQAKAAKADA